jgi:hypothetical protein
MQQRVDHFSYELSGHFFPSKISKKHWMELYDIFFTLCSANMPEVVGYCGIRFIFPFIQIKSKAKLMKILHFLKSTG